MMLPKGELSAATTLQATQTREMYPRKLRCDENDSETCLKKQNTGNKVQLQQRQGYRTRALDIRRAYKRFPQYLKRRTTLENNTQQKKTSYYRAGTSSNTFCLRGLPARKRSPVLYLLGIAIRAINNQQYHLVAIEAKRANLAYPGMI